jgi:hypothetical protein
MAVEVTELGQALLNLDEAWSEAIRQSELLKIERRKLARLAEACIRDTGHHRQCILCESLLTWPGKVPGGDILGHKPWCALFELEHDQPDDADAMSERIRRTLHNMVTLCKRGCVDRNGMDCTVPSSAARMVAALEFTPQELGESNG